MTDLTDFLLARIAEDATASQNDFTPQGALRRTICRVELRQVRRCAGRTEEFAREAIREIAIAHSDHPDFRKEWLA